MLRLLKCQKILKNQKIHYLEIIETKQNVYITTQYRNIRKRWVTLKKKKKIHGYNCRNFPNNFKYYKKTKKKTPKISMLKLPKGQKIKESKQSKPTNYRNNVKKCYYSVTFKRNNSSL